MKVYLSIIVGRFCSLFLQTTRVFIHRKLLPQLVVTMDFDRMSGFHSGWVKALSESMCVYYKPLAEELLWFMLWLFVRSKFTSKCSIQLLWSLMDNDPIATGPLRLCPVSCFLFEETFLLRTSTPLWRWKQFLHRRLFLPQLVLCALLVRESQLGHLFDSVSAFVKRISHTHTHTQCLSSLAGAVWL